MNYLVMPGIRRVRPKPKELIFVSPERIVAACMMYFDKPFDFFKQRCRDQHICYPRQVMIYLLATYTSLSLKEITLMVDKKDHSTVINACKAIKNYMDTDERRLAQVNAIIENF